MVSNDYIIYLYGSMRKYCFEISKPLTFCWRWIWKIWVSLNSIWCNRHFFQKKGVPPFLKDSSLSQNLWIFYDNCFSWKPINVARLRVFGRCPTAEKIASHWEKDHWNLKKQNWGIPKSLSVFQVKSIKFSKSFFWN